MTAADRLVEVLAALVLGFAGSGCGHAVLGRPIPSHGVRAKASDFAPTDDDVAVLHYYGVGGWGILWRGSRPACTRRRLARRTQNHSHYA